jgi:nucleotide-binding universal stress UspA family protein
VLIATDGSEAAAAAIRFARAMADRGAWAPEVITVCEPLPVSVAGLALPAPSTQHEVALSNSLIANLQRQLRRYGAAGWQLEVQFGRPSSLVSRAARDGTAELIVVGLGHHRALARALGADTALRVIRHSSLPVIAVSPSAGDVPKTAVVAMDFGDSSVRAAREALALLPPDGRLHLVHVKWGFNMTSLRDAEWDRAYAYGVEHGFKRLLGELAPARGIRITSELLHGPVVKSVLDAGRKIGADLVALGSHSQTVVDRLIVGSTTAEVLREATCSVLVAPPADAHP